MRVLGLTLTACVVLALSACSGGSDKKEKDGKGKEGKNGAQKSNAEKIIGTWEMEKPEAGAGTLMDFGKDGKVKVTVKGRPKPLEGTYKVEGDKLSITMKKPDGKDETQTETITTLTDTKLVTKDDKGKTSEFKKK